MEQHAPYFCIFFCIFQKKHNFIAIKKATMKKHILLTFSLLLSLYTYAQTVTTSEEIYVGSAEGYGIIGKFSDRVLFFTLDDSKVKVKAFDAKLHKVWDKEIEPDRKNHAKVIEVLNSRQDFNVIYQFRRKGQNLIKVHKYDPQVKLLDSTTVYNWSKEFVSPTLLSTYSEDKKIILLYEVTNGSHINALAVSLDSLRPIWYQSFDFKNWNDYENYTQVIVNNRGDAFFMREEENRGGDMDKHHVLIKHINGSAPKQFMAPLKDLYSLSIKFSYDNVNQQLVAVGVFSVKNFVRAQGYYLLTMTPPFEDYKILTKTFDDEFVSALMGKKITDNKGILDLQVQEIVHRRDGGVMAVIEQVKEVARQGNLTPNTGRLWSRTDGLRLPMDFYYDNVMAISMMPNGSIHWKSILYKKQVSQDDGARYCSYFLFKSPSALRFLFNDEIERATTVSEYVLNGAGESERHTIMNTGGQDIHLRFRDAMQVAANEVIVPSDDRRRVKLLKITY
jgi:hypothetical protein